MSDYYGTGMHGTTYYTRTSSSNIDAWLYAPPTYGSYQFSYWSGCSQISGTYCNVRASGGSTASVVAYYYYNPPNNTLNVYSSPSGIPISDYYGTGMDGWTNYTRTSSSAINTWLEAPWSYGSYQFSYWSGCSQVSGNYCYVYADGGGTASPVAYYYYNPPAPSCTGSLSCSYTTQYSVGLNYSYQNCTGGVWLYTTNYPYRSDIYSSPNGSGSTVVGWEPYTSPWSLASGVCYNFTLWSKNSSGGQGEQIAITGGCTWPTSIGCY
jgi:hypothetical protein